MCEVDDELEELNLTTDIFTDERGGRQIFWGRGLDGQLCPAEYRELAWRERPDGMREAVTFYTGFGWMTNQELFDLRWREPRIAP